MNLMDFSKRLALTAIALVLVACASGGNDVPSLASDDMQGADASAVVEGEPLDDEACAGD